jgi:hypothetical protein
VITFLGDLLIGGLLLCLAWVIGRFGSPLAFPRNMIRTRMPSKFSDETHRKVARFQDKALAASVAALGGVIIVGGLVNLLR